MIMIKERNIIKMLMMLFLITSFCGCKTDDNVVVKYNTVHDTIYIKDSTEILKLQKEVLKSKDSIKFIKDSLGEQLFVANYKLQRIKYYNDIAKNGNNIKYLRGWINRVLNK